MKKNINDCMVTYVEDYFPYGHSYKLKTGEYHIGNYEYSLKEYNTGDVRGCYVEDENITVSIINTIYCGQTYIVKKMNLDKYLFYRYSKEYKDIKNKFITYFKKTKEIFI